MERAYVCVKAVPRCALLIYAILDSGGPKERGTLSIYSCTVLSSEGE